MHQWVRIKGGIHRDDLGLIELVDGNRKALVRLIPRIPEDFYTDREKTLSSLRALSRSQSEYIRIPQRLFNPLRVKEECQRELYRPLDKYFFFWRRMMFRNGFLYQEFAANKLITENVCPSLQEVRMFQLDPTLHSTADLFEDELDEWDRLDDDTLQKTIRDDPQLQVQEYDHVRVIDGQFKNVVGVITSVHDGIVSLTTAGVERTGRTLEVQVRAHQVRKHFKIGEYVRVI